MLKKIVFGFIGVVGLAFLTVLAIAATKPATYRVERTHTIAAAPDRVLPFLSDLDAWQRWNPWRNVDPNMSKELSASHAGPGAWYAWSGNSDAGKGKITILAVSPTGVDYRLEFIEPFASVATQRIALAPDGAGTRVTWSMEGSNSFLGKVMSVFASMDELIGRDFERGLVDLDAAVTSSPGAPSAS